MSSEFESGWPLGLYDTKDKLELYRGIAVDGWMLTNSSCVIITNAEMLWYGLPALLQLLFARILSSGTWQCVFSSMSMNIKRAISNSATKSSLVD